jgi:hypothetical protein
VNQQRTTPNLLGGQGTYNRFETESQAANRSCVYGGDSTRLEQLTDKGRSMYVKGKKEVEPMFMQSMREGGYNPQRGAAVRGENPYDLNPGANRPANSLQQIVMNDGLDNSNLVGYRQHHGGHASASLTKGLSSSLVDSLPSKPVKRDITVAPFATDGSSVTDPYMNANGQRSKDMFVENFRSGGGIPGYTGRRGR